MTSTVNARVMLVAVASERRPKVDGVRRALARIADLSPQAWSEVELWTRATHSGVRATPLSDDEMRRGARQRAQALCETFEPGAAARATSHPGSHAGGRTLFVGLEGGVHVERSSDHVRGWLRGWAYVTDTYLEGWGCGPSIELPEAVTSAVVAGEDLAAIIDRVSGQTDVRSRGGTWGILTRGLLTRSETFEAAALAAFARFYNPEAYVSR